MLKGQGFINGVNTDQLFETIDNIKGDPGIAKFKFRAKNRWENGGYNSTTIMDFYGAKQENEHEHDFVLGSDEPQLLLGQDQGANPVEYVLTALAGCLTTSMIYHAAARGIVMEEVESELEGDLDLRGFLGLSDNVRNGFENIRVTFRIESDASQKELDELIELAQKRSPVFDIVTHPVPVSVKAEKVREIMH